MAKTFSGKHIVKILEKHFGFVAVSQRGSHMKLKRTHAPLAVTVVPLHKELARGTLRGVLELAKVEEKDFYSKAK